jgi:hypothetical protein
MRAISLPLKYHRKYMAIPTSKNTSVMLKGVPVMPDGERPVLGAVTGAAEQAEQVAAGALGFCNV